MNQYSGIDIVVASVSTAIGGILGILGTLLGVILG